jgi:hypothetical protein
MLVQVLWLLSFLLSATFEHVESRTLNRGLVGNPYEIIGKAVANMRFASKSHVDHDDEADDEGDHNNGDDDDDDDDEGNAMEPKAVAKALKSLASSQSALKSMDGISHKFVNTFKEA